MSDPKNKTDKARVLILVENLSVPFDRRVWAEAQALTEEGYKVSVICPNKPNTPLHEVINGVNIYRYPAPKEGRGAVGYFKEYAYSLIAAFRLSLKVRKLEGFDLIQACNPPDILYVIGQYHKWMSKSKFIFDHHDLSPELFSEKFGDKNVFIRKMLFWFERRTFKTADVVISTNESFKQIAIKRGGKSPDTVFVVRNGPNTQRFVPRPPKLELKNGRQHMVCYVGVMAGQDGLDYLLRAVDHIVNTCDRKDITFTLIGSGDILDDLKQMAQDLKIADCVVFTGRIDDDELLTTYISTSDVCVAPDPNNDLNDKSTLIKIAEYMSIGKPVVSFDLTESTFTAGDAALYASNNDPVEFGNRVLELIDDPAKCAQMGEIGKQRVRDALSWEHSKVQLKAAYERALGG